MGVEIEHKFLVKTELLPRKLPRGEHMVQGYLSFEPAVRVRVVTGAHGKKAFLTIKGRGLRERLELEYPLPVADAKKMLKLCGDRLIEKTRRVIGPVELDEFAGKLKGLWIAEIELRTRASRLPKLPPWIGKDVTQDPRYTNVQLALKMKAPFNKVKGRR